MEPAPVHNFVYNFCLPAYDPTSNSWTQLLGRWKQLVSPPWSPRNLGIRTEARGRDSLLLHRLSCGLVVQAYRLLFCSPASIGLESGCWRSLSQVNPAVVESGRKVQGSWNSYMKGLHWVVGICTWCSSVTQQACTEHLQWAYTVPGTRIVSSRGKSGHLFR